MAERLEVMCTPCVGTSTLFCLSLICNFGHRVLEQILIRKIVMTYTLEIRIKHVNQRNSCRDIEFNNFFVRDLVEIFDECPKTVVSTPLFRL